MIAIRTEYEKCGVDNFYKNCKNYSNPHLLDIRNAIIKLDYNNFGSILDLSAGSGQITNILTNLGQFNISGSEPYLFDEYVKNTSKSCLNFTFSDIQLGKLNYDKFDTIICSYALHLCEQSILPDVLWNLSLISKRLIILSPNNKPVINQENGWIFVDKFKEGKTKIKIYNSINN
jgi:hypothetical protein